jgi:IS30 family transposase
MQKKKSHKGGRPFSLRERSIIEVRWGRDSKSVTDIAKELKRNKSSISREIDGKPRKGVGKYNAEVAHRKALERISHRGNVPKTAKNERLKSYIEDKLKD